MTGVRNRIDAFIDWGWDYFTDARGPQVLDRPDATAIHWDEDLVPEREPAAVAVSRVVGERERPAAIAASGEQIEIAHGEQRAVIVEVGGGLRTYTAAGDALLDGYGAEEMSSSGRGQVLIPWPNRIQDGSYSFDGERHQLPINDVDEQDAIHGLVRWAAWTVAEREPHRVVMEHRSTPGPATRSRSSWPSSTGSRRTACGCGPPPPTAGRHRARSGAAPIRT